MLFDDPDFTVHSSDTVPIISAICSCRVLPPLTIPTASDTVRKPPMLNKFFIASPAYTLAFSLSPSRTAVHPEASPCPIPVIHFVNTEAGTDPDVYIDHRLFTGNCTGLMR